MCDSVSQQVCGLKDVTAFMVAAHLGKEGVLNLLLRAGADVNQANIVSLLLYAI
jgi:ankyrin repeat protein